MPPQVTPGGPGFKRAIVLDGRVISIQPAELRLTPEQSAEVQRTMDGTRRRWSSRPYFDGVANIAEPYTLTLPLEWIEEDDRRLVEECRARGGTHRLTIWRTECTIWTCKAGTQRYYFPHFRKVARHLYAGLQLDGAIFVTEENFPTLATLNGVELDVSYAVGPTLTDPGAGAIVIARQPDASGEALDYTAVRLGDAVATGDELIVWAVLTMECDMQQAEITLEGRQESHAYTFVEL